MEELSVLSSALCPYVWDFVEERGWEESVYSALSYVKTQQVVSLPTFEQLDPAKLKKVIKSTLEKISKASQSLASLPQTRKGPEEPELLAGNEIVERMVSARARTARKRNQVLASIPEPADGRSFLPSAFDSFAF